MFLCNDIFCDKLRNRFGHKLLQLIFSPRLTCTIHVIYNDSKTYTLYNIALGTRGKQTSHELMQTGKKEKYHETKNELKWMCVTSDWHFIVYKANLKVNVEMQRSSSYHTRTCTNIMSVILAYIIRCIYTYKFEGSKR